MPDIPVGSQIFDLAFSPTSSTVYTGLLSGEIKAFSYDEQGAYQSLFTLRPSKKSCRGLAMSDDGSRLWAVGKSKALHVIDVATEKVVENHLAAHDSAINRVKCLRPHVLSTGDDDGVVKLWDTRQPGAIRQYTHHFDFISDMLWLGDKKQLVSTSGDGTLSVIDIRSNKPEPLAHSEDQEDELLSIVPIKGGSKFVVGTQQGILSIFNRSSGWGDCVDRIPGHPSSVDALSTLPSTYPSAHSTILSGSSDGMVRVVQLYPTKLLGTLADHGDFPVERIRVDRGGEGRWVGSVGHDEVLKMTDLRDVFEDEAEAEDEEGKDAGTDEEADEGDEEKDAVKPMTVVASETKVRDAEAETEEAEKEEGSDVGDSDEDVESKKDKKRKRKQDKDPLVAGRRKKGRNEVEAESGFFADL